MAIGKSQVFLMIHPLTSGLIVTVEEFHCTVLLSTFGKKLSDLAKRKADAPDFDKELWMSRICPFDLTLVTVPKANPLNLHWGATSTLIQSVSATWSDLLWKNLEMYTFLVAVNNLFDSWKVKAPSLGDEMVILDIANTHWRENDTRIWELCMTISVDGDGRKLADAYGVLDPTNAQVYGQYVLSKEDFFVYMEKSGMPLPKPKPLITKKEHVQVIPIAQPTDSIATSGHAFTSQLETPRKEKIKTRGETGASAAQADNEEEEEELGLDSNPDNLPDSLPVEFRTGKKTMKASIHMGAARK